MPYVCLTHRVPDTYVYAITVPYLYLERTRRLQEKHRVQTDVASTKAKVLSSSKKVFTSMCLYIYIKCHNRSTVQMMMSVLDSEGAKRRRNHRLKWRVYQNKVLIHT